MKDKKEIVFRPKYERKLRWSIIGMFILVAGGSVMILSDNEIDIWATGSFALLALMLAVMPFAIIKEIRFGTKITIVRYLIPERICSYKDVKDIGLTGIQLPGLNVSWGQMENGEKLVEIVDGLIEAGIIPEEQLEGKRATQEFISYMALGYAMLPTLLVSSLLIYLGYYPRNIPIEIFGFLVFMGVYAPIHYFYKRWLSKKEIDS